MPLRALDDFHGCVIFLNSLSTEQEDTSASVRLLSFLSRLNPSSSSELQFGKCFAQHLVTSLGKLVSCHRRSYANSTTHRSKHRLLVALLILEPFVEDAQVRNSVIHILSRSGRHCFTRILLRMFAISWCKMSSCEVSDDLYKFLYNLFSFNFGFYYFWIT